MDRICTYTRKRIYNIDPFTQLFAIALVKKVFLTEKIETFEREREREREREKERRKVFHKTRIGKSSDKYQECIVQT